MKIAISASGKSLDDNVAELFGRCPYFVIAEVEDGKIIKTTALKNESENQSSGAGMAAAQLLAEKEVDAVIAKIVGPRAISVLKQFDIEVYNREGMIKNVLQEFVAKKLKK